MRRAVSDENTVPFVSLFLIDRLLFIRFLGLFVPIHERYRAAALPVGTGF